MNLLQLNQQLEELYYTQQIIQHIKKRNDLNLQEKNYLESTFIEITNPVKKNITVGCICRHHTIDLNEFHCYYHNPPLKKLAKEQKNIKQLLNPLTLCCVICSYLIISNQLKLSPIQSKSLLDNIFSHYICQEIIPGNLKSILSDYLPQFLFAPHIFSNAPNKKIQHF